MPICLRAFTRVGVRGCLLILAVVVLRCPPLRADSLGAALVKSSGVLGGLIVHLGGDVEVTKDLLVNDSYLVQGLYRKGVQKARESVAAERLYGKVSIIHFDEGNLPYSDNLVNLLVDENAEAWLANEELMRILAPRGVLLSKYATPGSQPLAGLDGWQVAVKSVPSDIDDWTHYLHGPDNNCVAKDDRIAPPYHTQCEGGPRWQRSHDYLASLSAMVSSEGRLFYIHDEGERSTIALPARWFLVARDAFNGIILWKRPIETWESHFRRFRIGPVDLSRRLVSVGGTVYVTLGYGGPVSVLDAATGETLMEHQGTEGAHEILVDGDSRVVFKGVR